MSEHEREPVPGEAAPVIAAVTGSQVKTVRQIRRRPATRRRRKPHPWPIADPAESIHGRVIEGPRTEDPPAPPADTVDYGGVRVAEFPPIVQPMLHAFELQFSTRVFSSIRTDHALRLTRLLMDLPAAMREREIARALYRLALRNAR